MAASREQGPSNMRDDGQVANRLAHPDIGGVDRLDLIKAVYHPSRSEE
jgi:hypothetical protein